MNEMFDCVSSSSTPSAAPSSTNAIPKPTPSKSESASTSDDRRAKSGKVALHRVRTGRRIRTRRLGDQAPPEQAPPTSAGLTGPFAMRGDTLPFVQTVQPTMRVVWDGYAIA